MQTSKLFGFLLLQGVIVSYKIVGKKETYSLKKHIQFCLQAMSEAMFHKSYLFVLRDHNNSIL